MWIAGEPSGDFLAAELAAALANRFTEIEAAPTADFQPLHASLQPEFFGAGGPRMADAGIHLAVDMTQHAIVGLWEVIKHYRQFRGLFNQLRTLAIQREPDAIICVDFSGFNLRLAHALRQYTRSLRGTFGNWNPKMIQFVSPQVWASRPERARRLAEDFDLLLSILPFEKEWYAQRTPKLRVEFVGHPILDRYGAANPKGASTPAQPAGNPATVLVLPGSREGELRRHLPVLLGALGRIRSNRPNLHALMVLPNQALAQEARQLGWPAGLPLQVGDLAGALARADLALASTGTVTLECAYFGVPTVALYKTSWGTYWAGKQVVRVKYLAMPNLMAGEEVFPEFIQNAATPENIARAALELLESPGKRAAIRAKLAHVVASLGVPGASRRAADVVAELIENEPSSLRAALSTGR